MKFTYGELIPDIIIETFYDRIKEKIEIGESYEHYTRNILRINGGKLPNKIRELIDENRTI